MANNKNAFVGQDKYLHEVVMAIYPNILSQISGEDISIPYIQGAPGGGKTASIKALAEKFDSEFMSTHFPLKMLEELGGIPDFVECQIGGEKRKATEWSFPEIIRDLYKKSDKVKVQTKGGVLVHHKKSGRLHSAYPECNEDEIAVEVRNDESLTITKVKGDKKPRFVVWLLDDMHLCSTIHMQMLYEILTERKVRDYVLPDNVAIILAGNTSQKAGAKTTFSAIVNRCAMLPVVTSFDYWKTEFAIPHGVHPAIVAFIGNESYRKYFHEEEEVDKPWSSPRSLTRFSNFLTQMEKAFGGNKIPTDDLLYYATSHIGIEAASEFVKFYSVFTSFDTEKMFNNIDFFLKEIKNLNPVEGYALAYALLNQFFSVDSKTRQKNGYYKKLADIITSAKETNTRFAEITVLMMKEIQSISQSNSANSKEIQKLTMEINRNDSTYIRTSIQDVCKHGN